MWRQQQQWPLGQGGNSLGTSVDVEMEGEPAPGREWEHSGPAPMSLEVHQWDSPGPPALPSFLGRLSGGRGEPAPCWVSWAHGAWGGQGSVAFPRSSAQGQELGGLWEAGGVYD